MDYKFFFDDSKKKHSLLFSRIPRKKRSLFFLRTTIMKPDPFLLKRLSEIPTPRNTIHQLHDKP